MKMHSKELSLRIQETNPEKGLFFVTDFEVSQEWTASQRRE